MKSNRVRVLLLAAIVLFGTSDVVGQFTWTKDARNPILSGVVGTWNKHIFCPCVLFNSDSARYEMWFNSTPGPQGFPNSNPYSIGFAVSKDGINWSMYPTAVLTSDAGKWDNSTVAYPEVIRENRQYKMWYTSWKDWSSPDYLGYATSPDGIHWTKYPGNPIFGPGTAAWEIGGPGSVSVMATQAGYKMWYSGIDVTFSNPKIGYATSADGINWKRDTLNNPVVTVGTSSQWDGKSVGSPNVLRIGNSYYMWYVGTDVKGTYDATGVATSSDGITNWKKYASNPVLATSPARWDATWAEAGTVLQLGDTLHMWYEGYTSPETANRIMIGHAMSPLIASGIAGENQELPATFFLSQNYPNPFNPSTIISYELPRVSNVTLRIFNALGQEVALLVNGQKEAGNYQTTWNASNIPSGVYFYRLQAGGYVETKKMVLLR